MNIFYFSNYDSILICRYIRQQGQISTTVPPPFLLLGLQQFFPGYQYGLPISSISISVWVLVRLGFRALWMPYSILFLLLELWTRVVHCFSTDSQISSATFYEFWSSFCHTLLSIFKDYYTKYLCNHLAFCQSQTGVILTSSSKYDLIFYSALPIITKMASNNLQDCILNRFSSQDIIFV